MAVKSLLIVGAMNCGLVIGCGTGPPTAPKPPGPTVTAPAPTTTAEGGQPKPAETLRFALDNRLVNAELRIEPLPLPEPDELARLVPKSLRRIVGQAARAPNRLQKAVQQAWTRVSDGIPDIGHIQRAVARETRRIDSALKSLRAHFERKPHAGIAVTIAVLQVHRILARHTEHGMTRPRRIVEYGTPGEPNNIALFDIKLLTRAKELASSGGKARLWAGTLLARGLHERKRPRLAVKELREVLQHGPFLRTRQRDLWIWLGAMESAGSEADHAAALRAFMQARGFATAKEVKPSQQELQRLALQAAYFAGDFATAQTLALEALARDMVTPHDTDIVRLATDSVERLGLQQSKLRDAHTLARREVVLALAVRYMDRGDYDSLSELSTRGEKLLGPRHDKAWPTLRGLSDFAQQKPTAPGRDELYAAVTRLLPWGPGQSTVEREELSGALDERRYDLQRALSSVARLCVGPEQWRWPRKAGTRQWEVSADVFETKPPQLTVRVRTDVDLSPVGRCLEQHLPKLLKRWPTSVRAVIDLSRIWPPCAGFEGAEEDFDDEDFDDEDFELD